MFTPTPQVYGIIVVSLSGLCPGSSLARRRQSGAWIQPVKLVAAKPRPSAHPRLVRGSRRRRPRRAPLEALFRGHDFTRFGFTRAKKVVGFDSNIKQNSFSTRTFGCIMRRFSGTYVNGQYPGILLAPLSTRRDVHFQERCT